ncbi:phage protein GemA/Gp16 family protein [Longimicrobium sp.]|jgi:hypothetical protein|uniref:phage protein GemA/Gp16 family protein n=1 Tax=Longimicrobium sp. TaxID=2029185 RepID=UPI002ED7BA66
MPTPAETRKLFAGAREAGLDVEQLRDLVEAASGQRSTKQLNRDQTRQVIDALVKLGARAGTPGRKPSGKRQPAGVTAMITPAQRTYIADLRAQLGGDWLKDEYFAGACKKRMGKTGLTTSADANRAIELLKKRIAYNAQRAAG